MALMYNKPGVTTMGQTPNGSAQSKLLPGGDAICSDLR